MPSSLVTRMRIVTRSCGPLDGLEPAHVALQRVRHRDRAALLLVGFHDRDESAPDRDARAVERVDEPHLAVLAAEARVHAPRLEVAADRARGDFPIGVLPGQPYFDVVGFL